LVRRVD